MTSATQSLNRRNVSPTYRTMVTVLDGLATDSSRATAEANLSVIDKLGGHKNIRTLLGELLDDSTELERIAERSYRHTNHFDKIVLIDMGRTPGYRLTLHLWRPPYADDDAADEQIHDHRFSFWSKVLVGDLVSENFVRDGEGTVFEEYQYIPEKRHLTTVGNFYQSVGATHLRSKGLSVARAGQSYTLSFYRIHRVLLPRESTTCTLVLRGPRQKNYASVFSTSKKYCDSANAMFTSEELAQKLVHVLQQLNCLGARR